MIVESVRDEFRRYKALAEGAIGQLEEADLTRPGPGDGSSIAVICAHIAGNLRSRFTDFLTADGEKPWRNREGEFERRAATRAQILSHWDEGWSVLFATLDTLGDQHLARTIQLRGHPLAVHEALHRALAHVAYHVGQIVYLAKGWRGAGWQSLSIPPGQSDAYNRNPDKERPSRG